MNTIRYGIAAGVAALLLTLQIGCWDVPRSTPEADPAEVWNLIQTVDVDVEVGEALRQSGVLRLEVRHSAVRHGRLIYDGTLSEDSAWRRAFTTRLGRHESEVRVALTNGDWIRIRTVPVGEDGRIATRFE